MCSEEQRCRLRLFDKRYGGGYGEGSFAGVKLQRLGNISQMTSNCEPSFRKEPPNGAQQIRDCRSLSEGTRGQTSGYWREGDVGLQRMLRQVAFDRLLARLFRVGQSLVLPWVLCASGRTVACRRIRAARIGDRQSLQSESG